LNFFAFISEWINGHPGQAVGAFLGFLIGILILIFGIVKTLLVLILAAIGFIIGKLIDDKISLVSEIKGFFRRNKQDHID